MDFHEHIWHNRAIMTHPCASFRPSRVRCSTFWSFSTKAMQKTQQLSRPSNCGIHEMHPESINIHQNSIFMFKYLRNGRFIYDTWDRIHHICRSQNLTVLHLRLRCCLRCGCSEFMWISRCFEYMFNGQLPRLMTF